MIIERFDSSLQGMSLQDRLTQETAQYPDVSFHWSYLDWSRGERFHEGGEQQIPSASIRKVSILMGALAASKRGEFDLSESFETRARYHEVDSGIFHRLRPGISLTYEDALKAMIMLSDNASTVAVMERFSGVEYFNAYCERIGLHQTVHRQELPDASASLEDANLTSSNDTIKLLSWIERGKTDIEVAHMLEVDPAHCNFATTVMKGNKINDRLPILLPRGVAVAHKTGTIPASDHSIIADVGTIYSYEDADKPLFSLAVFAADVPDILTEGTPGKAAVAQTIGKMARICYDAAFLG
jgi:beta-lactamase class A